MAGTTSKGLRFPSAGDNPAVHTDIQNLATDVDTELNDYALLSGAVFTGNIQVATEIAFEGSVADGFETTLTVVNPTADRVVTIPDATGTVVLATATQTLTNKTLTSPVISSITNGAATLTLPASTGTFALTSDITPDVTNENHARTTVFMLGGM
jgi:hypothetical protein